MRPKITLSVVTVVVRSVERPSSIVEALGLVLPAAPIRLEMSSSQMSHNWAIMILARWGWAMGIQIMKAATR